MDAGEEKRVPCNACERAYWSTWLANLRYMGNNNLTSLPVGVLDRNTALSVM